MVKQKVKDSPLSVCGCCVILQAPLCFVCYEDGLKTRSLACHQLRPSPPHITSRLFVVRLWWPLMWKKTAYHSFLRCVVGLLRKNAKLVLGLAGEASAIYDYLSAATTTTMAINIANSHHKQPQKCQGYMREEKERFNNKMQSACSALIAQSEVLRPGWHINCG